MKNHTNMLIFHTAICAGASQIATDDRRELDVLVATPSLRSGMEINMITRKAEWKDIPRIMELLKQVNNVHAHGRPDLFIPDKTKYTENELEGIICDPTTPVFVGVDDKDTVLGYAFCVIKRTIGQNNLVDNIELYIDDLCFDEPFRGQGLAKELFDEVIHYAKKNAFDRVTLHVWECNETARHFYEKCGMKPYYSAMERVISG